MSIYTHTPRPWTATEAFDGWQIIGADNNAVAGEIINGDDMGEADAQLIAAAPDMVECLQELITNYEKFGLGKGLNYEHMQQWDAAIKGAKQVVFEAIGTLESRGDDSQNARNLADQECDIKIVCGSTLGVISPESSDALSKAIPAQHVQQKGGNNA